jgi:hypothetical protein
MSKVCVLDSKICNGHEDCPNGMDEHGCTNNLTKYDKNNTCNSGQFPCDDGVCRPLYEKCNGFQNCLDGSDELNCTGHETVYQIDGLRIEEVEQESAFVEWWVNSQLKGNMEFLISHCDVRAHICKNATDWTKDRKFTIGGPGEEKLRSFTKYSVTVYVKKNGTVYPPAIYETFYTKEGVPEPPYNLTVSQLNTDGLCVSWKKPRTPNGNITSYRLSWSPPSPPDDMTSFTETLCISNKQSDPVFIPGTNYTFWVIAINGGGKSRNSESLVYSFSGDVATDAEASTQVSISVGSAVGVAITVILVVGVLVGTLAIFVVRHRRLRMSFLNFASSHYSTSSGAATFQQSMEEEHDSPVIRGFSDDEPLLVA